MVDGLVSLSVGVRLSCDLSSLGKLYRHDTPFDLALTDPEDSSTVHQWMFPHIYTPGATHQEVYATLLGPQVEKTLTQGNSCCLVYGHPDSGKSNLIFGEAGLLDQLLTRLLTDIKADEKGVKAAIACLSLHNNLCTDLFSPLSSPVSSELKENMGIFAVPDTTWLNIKSVSEPLMKIRQAERQLSTTNRPNLFILVTISRYKTVMSPISSLILADITTLQPLEADSLANSLNHTSLQPASIVILGKILSELCYEARDESILTMKGMGGEWDLALLACVMPTPAQYVTCLNGIKYANKAQSYPATLKKLRKREFKESSADNKLILQLRGDIIDLKFDLFQREAFHSKLLKDISLKIGLDFDLNLLRDLDEQSREGKAVKLMRESLERAEVYKQGKVRLEERNRTLEAKIEDSRGKSVAATRKNNAEMANFEEEVRLAREKLEEITPNLPANLQSEAEKLQLALDTGIEELQSLSSSMNELYSVTVSRSENAEFVVGHRRNGRESMEIDLRKEYKSEEAVFKRTISSLEKDYEVRIKEKNGQRSGIEAQIRKNGLLKAAVVAAWRSECSGLAWTTKQMESLIEGITHGVYNNGVVPVVIPHSHLPDFPLHLISKQYSPPSFRPNHEFKGLYTVREVAEAKHQLSHSVELPKVRKRGSDGYVDVNNGRKLLIRLKENISEIEALKKENEVRRSLMTSISAQFAALKALQTQYRELQRNQKVENLVRFR